MAKSAERIEARELRNQGWSIKQIAKELKVSTSTVSLWNRDVKLSQQQVRELERRGRDPFYGRRLLNSLRQKKERELRTKKIMSEGMKRIGDLTIRERLIAGVALYWAEGFKKDKMAGFANSDSGMVKFILRWLKECMGIEEKNIRLRVGINEGQKDRTDEIQNYWSQVAGIPLESFYKPFYQKVAWKKIYEHPELYMGTLRVRILKSTDLLRRILGMIEGLKLEN